MITANYQLSLNLIITVYVTFKRLCFSSNTDIQNNAILKRVQ